MWGQVRVFNRPPHRSGQAGQGESDEHAGNLTQDGNVKLASAVILVSTYTRLCFQSTLQWFLGNYIPVN